LSKSTADSATASSRGKPSGERSFVAFQRRPAAAIPSGAAKSAWLSKAFPLGQAFSMIAAFTDEPLAHRLALRMQWEFRRQSCLKIDWFSVDGVVEFQILGVQEISSVAGEAREIFKRLAG
jgi:hypothetical protein